MYQMYLVLGDWSDDGHGKSDKILVNVNWAVKNVQDAYKASCKLTGISFNNGEDYTGLKRPFQIANNYKIAVEYEDSKLHENVLEVLEKFKCPTELIEYYKEEAYDKNYIALWFWFVSLSLPGLEYTIDEKGDGIPCINGYWDKNLNVGFGYGLYL